MIASCLVYSDSPKKVLCELEGIIQLLMKTLEEIILMKAEIAKNVAVTITQSIFFLNRAKQTLNKDAWDKNKIDVTNKFIDGSSDDLLTLDYVIEPAPVWITQSTGKKRRKKPFDGYHFLENGVMHPNYPSTK